MEFGLLRKTEFETHIHDGRRDTRKIINSNFPEPDIWGVEDFQVSEMAVTRQLMSPISD